MKCERALPATDRLESTWTKQRLSRVMNTIAQHLAGAKCLRHQHRRIWSTKFKTCRALDLIQEREKTTSWSRAITRRPNQRWCKLRSTASTSWKRSEPSKTQDLRAPSACHPILQLWKAMRQLKLIACLKQLTWSRSPKFCQRNRSSHQWISMIGHRNQSPSKTLRPRIS